MKRIHWLRHTAMGLALALLVAACGTDEPAPEPEPEAAPAEEPAEEPDEADDRLVEPLRLGYVLPETGPLAFLAPAQIGAVQMAVAEVNEAGGVLGFEVQLEAGDEAGDAAVASESADRLLADGVHAIVGAAASTMSFAIIDQITGSGVVQCSASNTGPGFTDYPDNGFYFRTAPSDALQGPVLAELIAEAGHVDIALMARADDYGAPLMNLTAAALEEVGANILYQEAYDPEQTTFDAEASEIAASGADAVVIIPFAEGVQILQALIEQGVDPANIYGADGIRGEDIAERVDPNNPNVIDGFQGTAPDPTADPSFVDRLRAFNPDAEVIVYAPEMFDCTMLIMLAAEAAGSVDSTHIRDNMLAVTRGDNPCNGFEECAELLRAGESIAYQFISGVEALSDGGEPINGSYEVWRWVDGELTTIETREARVD